MINFNWKTKLDVYYDKTTVIMTYLLKRFVKEWMLEQLNRFQKKTTSRSILKVAQKKDYFRCQHNVDTSTKGSNHKNWPHLFPSAVLQKSQMLCSFILGNLCLFSVAEKTHCSSLHNYLCCPLTVLLFKLLKDTGWETFRELYRYYTCSSGVCTNAMCVKVNFRSTSAEGM